MSLQDVDGACEVVHRLLDDLPLSNTFLLDIICVCDKVDNKWPQKYLVYPWDLDLTLVKEDFVWVTFDHFGKGWLFEVLGH